MPIAAAAEKSIELVKQSTLKVYPGPDAIRHSASGPPDWRYRLRRLKKGGGMNEQHKQCGSDEWRELMRETILPWALGDLDLGDDVLEVGPGYGATTDAVADSVHRFSGAVCFTMLHHVPTVALQDRLFAEVARVLRPGSVFVSSDSLASPDLEGHHRGDTYNPIDPKTVGRRLETAGFAPVQVKRNPFGWAAVARKPSLP